MRPFASLLCLLCLCAASAASGQTVPLFSQTVPLNPKNANQLDAGQLIYRGGVALRSTDRRFGGYSGLHISADGRRLLAISDRGTWLRMTLRYDDRGNLAGAGSASLGPLKGVDGAALEGRLGDAEGLAILPDGSALVAYERRHRILHYPAASNPLAGRPRPFPAPPDLAAGPANGGLETLVHVGRGYLLTISERQRAGPRTLRGWVGVDGSWRAFSYARKGGFRPSDATLLPNGDVLVLERRFLLGRGNAIRIVRIPRRSIAPGRTIRGRIIARLAAPMTVDNFEGIAARPAAAGETMIYLISDDNFNPLQRTLLMMFSLRGPLDGQPSARVGVRRRRFARCVSALFLGLQNAAFQAAGLARQLAVRRAGQEGVQAAVPFDSAETRGRHLQAYDIIQTLAVERHGLHVRQEPAPGAALGVAHVIAGQHALACNAASPGHISVLLGPMPVWQTEKSAASSGAVLDSRIFRWRSPPRSPSKAPQIRALREPRRYSGKAGSSRPRRAVSQGADRYFAATKASKSLAAAWAGVISPAATATSKSDTCSATLGCRRNSAVSVSEISLHIQARA